MRAIKVCEETLTVTIAWQRFYCTKEVHLSAIGYYNLYLELQNVAEYS